MDTTPKSPLEILGDQRKAVRLMSKRETFGSPTAEPDSRPADTTLAVLDDMDNERSQMSSVITSAELIRRTGGGGRLGKIDFPPEMRMSREVSNDGPP